MNFYSSLSWFVDGAENGTFGAASAVFCSPQKSASWWRAKVLSVVLLFLEAFCKPCLKGPLLFFLGGGLAGP